MEALNFLKFWRPTVFISPPPLDDSEEDDDSFFELDLNLPDLNDDTQIEDQRLKISPKITRVTLFPSSCNLFSGRKILPVESQRGSWPQRRISLFKPPTKLRMFSKFSNKSKKSMPTSETEQSEETEYLQNRVRSNLSAAEIKEALSVSKRFLKLVKPFSGKGHSERDGGEEGKFCSKASPLSSPVVAAWKLTGKGKPPLLKGGCVLPPAREEEKHEGIQSAILHCKKSFHSPSRSQLTINLNSCSVSSMPSTDALLLIWTASEAK